MCSFRFFRYTFCALILTFFSFNVFAAKYSSKEAAYAACLAQAEATISRSNVKDVDCVEDPAVKVTPQGVTLQGGYICKYRTQTSSQVAENRYNVGFCPSTITNQNTTADYYSTFTYTSRYPSADPFASNYYFYWEGIVDPCLNTPDLENSFRSTSPNGTGNTCNNGCAYSVSVGYEGTWPVGKVTYYATSLKRQCNSSDASSTDAPLPPDTPPLDIDGETPDPGPEPGDGEKPGSSGGGDCNTPPKCQGDSIQCNILYQTWANRCKSGGGNDGGGGEGGEGEPTDLTPITSRWDNTFGKGPYGGDENTPLPGISERVTDVVYDSSSFDTSGFGLSRSCPVAMREYSFSWGQWSFNMPFNELCSWFDMIGRIVMVLGAFFGCVILLRGKS